MKAAMLRLAASLRDLSPASIAILLAVGLVLGTFPAYGGPTVLCFVAAVIFRLNAPALHLVNQVTSPLQLALCVPFARLGEWVIGPTHASGSILSRAGGFTLHAIAGWVCAAVPAGLLFFIVLWIALRRREQPASETLERA